MQLNVELFCVGQRRLITIGVAAVEAHVASKTRHGRASRRQCLAGWRFGGATASSVKMHLTNGG